MKEAGMVPELYFEDIEPGMPAYSREYPVTESEIIEYALRWDDRPMHIDREAAARSRFGSLIASASHTLAIRYALFRDIDQRAGELATIAGLGAEYWLPNPVRPGDRLRLRREVTGKRRSRSRPQAGIVTMSLTMSTADGLVVLDEPVARALIACREASDAGHQGENAGHQPRDV
jgi:acyl dehydratase